MGRKALPSPEDSARLWMLEHCLKVHRVRFVACVNALTSTQARPCLSGLSISIFDLLSFRFLMRDSFRQNLTYECRVSPDPSLRGALCRGPQHARWRNCVLGASLSLAPGRSTCQAARSLQAEQPRRCEHALPLLCSGSRGVCALWGVVVR